MKNPSQRPELVMYLLRKMATDPEKFAEDLVDIFNILEAKFGAAMKHVDAGMAAAELADSTIHALHGMVVDYTETIDTLCTENDELNDALDTACSMIKDLQGLSGHALLYGPSPSVLVN